MTVYTGPGGATGPTGSFKQSTALSTATAGQLSNGRGSEFPTLNFDYVAAGSRLTTAVTCPPAGQSPPPIQYTATASTLVLFNGQHVERLMLR